MLTVAGIGRWILETKPPDDEITKDDIDQATSYARHPEVSGCYAAVLNGKKFVLYHSNQTSNDEPLVELEVINPEALAGSLKGLLSPGAIRRDFPRPKIDMRAPLADGYRGEATITGGSNLLTSVRMQTDLPLPPAARAAIETDFGKIEGMHSVIRKGLVWRDAALRIRAKVQWQPPHEGMKDVLEKIHLDDFEYVCLSDEISIDPDKPSVFEILASYRLEKGQPTYDILRWKQSFFTAQVDVSMVGQATGYLKADEFMGVADYRMVMTMPGVPFPMTAVIKSDISFTVDAR